MDSKTLAAIAVLASALLMIPPTYAGSSPTASGNHVTEYWETYHNGVSFDAKLLVERLDGETNSASDWYATSNVIRQLDGGTAYDHFNLWNAAGTHNGATPDEVDWSPGIQTVSSNSPVSYSVGAGWGPASFSIAWQNSVKGQWDIEDRREWNYESGWDFYSHHEYFDAHNGERWTDWDYKSFSTVWRVTDGADHSANFQAYVRYSEGDQIQYPEPCKTGGTSVYAENWCWDQSGQAVCALYHGQSRQSCNIADASTCLQVGTSTAASGCALNDPTEAALNPTPYLVPPPVPRFNPEDEICLSECLE